MTSHVHVYILLMFVFCVSCRKQNKTELPKDEVKSMTKDVIPSYGPNSVTRSVKQDRKGNLWIASWEGVFLYDGKSFTNLTSEVSSSRFFSILEDRKGNLWFGTIGSGVYYYDGGSFQNFTTRDGLINNEIVCIYEDRIGNIWFGANGGVSRYDGMSFRNYTMTGDVMSEDKTGRSLPDVRPSNEVSSIWEDKTGKLWFGTKGNTLVYDGKAFTVFKYNDKSFMNVRSIIEDRKGNIWLGGNDGLWRYDGSICIRVAQKFGGFIYEDRSGYIWTSLESPEGWALCRYDDKSLSTNQSTVTEIKSKEVIFGILEARDGSIWFAGASGVYRYDGNTITDFRRKEDKK
jgi:ligand-binding sensor domain-containing protein